MKRILTIAATCLLTSVVLAPAAFASGQRAGGPAYKRNSETGGAVRRNRAVRPMRSGQAAGGPAGSAISTMGGSASRQGTVSDPSRVVPPGTSRSGQRAGGSTRQ